MLLAKQKTGLCRRREKAQCKGWCLARKACMLPSCYLHRLLFNLAFKRMWGDTRGWWEGLLVASSGPWQPAGQDARVALLWAHGEAFFSRAGLQTPTAALTRAKAQSGYQSRVHLVFKGKRVKKMHEQAGERGDVVLGCSIEPICVNSGQLSFARNLCQIQWVPVDSFLPRT